MWMTADLYARRGESARIMTTPLARYHLLHNKVRTTMAVAGLAFPIVLVFMQLGLYEACLVGSTRLYDALDFDFVLLSAEYVAVGEPGKFPRPRLAQALAVPGVWAVTPLYMAFHVWRNPDTQLARKLLVIGGDPQGRAFRLSEVSARLHALHQSNAVLIDRLSLPDFGPQYTGLVTEVNGRRITIVGQYTLGLGFVADGSIIVSDTTFAQISHSRVDDVHVGLVQLAPGADPLTVVQALRRSVPRDVRVLSRTELEATERQYWIQSTSLGIILGSGVIVGFLVEMVIVYQVLSTDITNHFPEYATLKAMGYRYSSLAWIVLQHAVLLGAGGYLGGFGVALGLYRVIAEAVHFPISMSLTRGVGVCTVTLLVCIGAGLLALHKVRLADPAELF
jgi:putative ABC transport system permease protein